MVKKIESRKMEIKVGEKLDGALKGTNKRFVFNTHKWFSWLIIILAVFLVLNLKYTLDFKQVFNQKFEEAKELARPANIQLVTIEASDCDDCFDTTSVIEQLKAKNVKVTKEETKTFSDAADLINEYNIEKLPTVLVFGEIKKTKLGSFEESADAMVFSGITPPYYNVKTKQIDGLVKATYIKAASCSDCEDLNKVIEALRQAGIKIVEVVGLDLESADVRGLIKKYDIKKVPALILSKEAVVYNEVNSIWEQLGTVENDGSYVTRFISPPYVDTSTKEIKGLVDLTFVTDDSCKDCYDVRIHKNILAGFGLAYDKEVNVDEAKRLGFKIILILDDNSHSEFEDSGFSGNFEEVKSQIKRIFKKQ